MTKKNVLVVAAHPDDEVLGCGATMVKHRKEGDTVWTLILGEGITSRQNLSASEKRVRLDRLSASAQKANKLLGVKRLIQRGFPDNRFDDVPRLSIIQTIEAVLLEFHPDLVYTHSSVDLNIDHQITSEAVRTACRPSSAQSVRHILAFEVPSSTEVRFQPNQAFNPNVFMNVAKFLDQKIRAIKAYGGEMRPFPHPRSEKYLRALAQVRGGQSGFQAAEAFCLLRSVIS